MQCKSREALCQVFDKLAGELTNVLAASHNLDPAIKGILHAEALAAHKSMSTLVQAWIDERLDLPVR